MTCKMAVWLDHKRALVVTACDRKVTSDVVEFEEPGARESGGVRAAARAGVHGVDPDGRRDARQALYLQRYFDRIIELLARADQIHLMGPGQAKLELKHRLREHKALSAVPIAVETVDRLTDAQVVAHARDIFGVPLRRAAGG